MLPVRGATRDSNQHVILFHISIHAPRAGSDLRVHGFLCVLYYFNPCSPCGERPSSSEVSVFLIKFQSMLPVRGATGVLHPAGRVEAISIHAPRAGSDPWTPTATRSPENFNPCSPCGERHEPPRFVERHFLISIHAPRAGSDQHERLSGVGGLHFNPCSPCGERPGSLSYRM